MSAPQENSKQAKRDLRIRLRKHRLVLGGAILATVAGVAGWVGYASVGGSAKRAVASAPTAPTGKSVEQVVAEVRSKEDFQRKSPEWGWAEEGHTEKVLAAYREVKPGNTHTHEEHTRLLNILDHTVKERKEWPSAFNQGKAQEVVDLLREILASKPGPGAEPVTAMHVLAHYALKIPEFHAQAERILLQNYQLDDRLGPRGACLAALSLLQSPRAIALLRKATQGTEHATTRAAMYSLANYLETPSERQPREILVALARRDPELMPLSVKLLAYHGVKSAGDFVPKLLTAQAGPAQVEAGAYAIERLKLKQYAGLLRQYQDRADTPFLRQQIDAALKAVQ